MGKALQVLKFGEGKVGKYHYYLQVNGKTGAESNDFSTGSHTGVLRHRPNKYVPVKVPLFDETLTNVNKIIQLQNNPDAKGTNAEFDWVYRPELSFSVVDLEVSSILLHSNDPEDDPLELVNATDPVISTQDSAVEIFYKLLTSQYGRITPLDGEQTFILAFGEEEIEITVSDDGTPIKFTNLEHLAEIKPEDYFSIRLYLNEDSQNVLWDWAFKVDGINLITSSDEGSRDKKSFIMCEVAQVNANTCELQSSIKAQLVASLDDDDIIVWKVEALKGNMEGDDLDSRSNASNKPYMYGKTKKHKVSKFNSGGWANVLGVGTGMGKYESPFNSTNLIYKDAKHFSFEPDMSGEAHTPAVYQTDNKPGTKRTNVWRSNPHVAYKVTATINGKEYSAIAKMDHTDVLRLEYINHLSSAADAAGKSVRVPKREDLRAVPSSGSWVEKNEGDSSYAYNVMVDESMSTLLTQLTSAIDANINKEFAVSGYDSVSWPSGATIVITSGYRNPERNERVGGASGSRHMMGRALDIAIKGVEGADKEIAYYVLWEILKANPPASANLVQLENRPQSWTKKYVYSWAEPEDDGAEWDSLDREFEDTGIEDGFSDVEHLHLQDNP